MRGGGSGEQVSVDLGWEHGGQANATHLEEPSRRSVRRRAARVS